MPPTTKLSSNITVENATVDMALNDPEAQAKFNLKGDVSTLAGTSTGTILDAAAMADMAAALKAGFATDATFTYGAGAFDFDFAEKEQTATGNATMGGGDIRFAMDAARMNYGGGAKDVTLTIASSDMPFPQLTTSYAEAAFNLLMPVSKADEPGDFALLTRLIDFRINDEVWDMFDPGKVLPRDPATVILDATGKLRWLVDIMDPAADRGAARRIGSRRDQRAGRERPEAGHRRGRGDGQGRLHLRQHRHDHLSRRARARPARLTSGSSGRTGCSTS